MRFKCNNKYSLYSLVEHFTQTTTTFTKAFHTQTFYLYTKNLLKLNKTNKLITI